MEKKLSVLILIFVSFCSLTKSRVTKAPITTGNLVVLRVDGAGAALSTASASVFLDEYNTAGVLNQSIAVPTSISGANLALTCAGSSTAEGQMTRSADGRYLLFAGYNAAPGTASIAGTTSAATNRVVGRLDIATGAINTTTGLNVYASAGNVRCAASTNGTDIWICSSNGGVGYTTLGANTSVQLSITPTNNRNVNIFNNQLYISTASGVFQGLSSIGTGTPLMAGQITTLLSGFPTTTGPSPYSFSIKPTTGNIAYVADDRALASGGGVQKWTLTAGVWSLTYTLTTSLTAGVRGLSVDWSGANPVLYGTTADVPTKLIKITDAGVASSATTLATAATNTAFRGIAFIPTGAVLPVQFSNVTVQQINNHIKIDWSNLTEANVANYIVERSADGISFKSIATIASAKNNGTNADYTFTDSFPINGNNFYRIHSNELDGKTIYSSIVKVEIKNSETDLSIFPNPVMGNQLTFQVSTLPKGNYSIRVINNIGQQLYNFSLIHKGGAFSKTLQLPIGIKAGLYKLQLVGDGINKAVPFIVQ
jgi:hypothetical protein